MSLIRSNDRIFVAGARGMAGNAIFRALKRKNYGNSEQGGEILTPNREELDLLDDAAVSTWMYTNRPDVVVLAAATVGGIEANRSRPSDFLLQNLRIELQVIEAAWRAGVRRLLFLGSSCIYPKYCEQPIIEDSLLTGSLEPTNEWYAVAKIAGIKLCQALRIQHGFDAISLMPTNLYGPGDNYHPTDSHVLPALIRRFHEAKENDAESVTCWGSGEPRREFLHADDLGEACVFCLENWDPSCEDAPRNKNGEALSLLNVGTGMDCSIKDIAQQIAKTVGYTGTILWDTSKPNGTPKKVLNVRRLTSLGWKAQIPLSKGLEETYADFLEHHKLKSLRESGSTIN